MSAGAEVTRHYSAGGLLDRVLAGLKALGKGPDGLTPGDLTPVEHLHTGGAPATAAFIAQLDLGPATNVLDIGCGIGGVSRAIAHATGAHVTGVDLTPDFVATARALSATVGLDHLTEFHVGGATDLPIRDRLFDVAVMVHVGMNIADKTAIFAEAHRVLHPDGRFAIYEVMTGPNPGDLMYPLPWSSAPETSHLATSGTYAACAAAAGFRLDRTLDLRGVALDKLHATAPPAQRGPFGRHLVMGDTAELRFANYDACITSGRIAPVEMFFTRL